MTSEASRVYFDTSVILGAFLGPKERKHAECVGAIQDAQAGRIFGVMSALVVAEATGAPNHRQGVSPSVAKKAMKAAAAFTQNTGMQMVDISTATGKRAAELAIEFQLKGPDALHLALALEARCTHLYTCDGGLLKVGDYGHVTVCEPIPTLAPPLDFGCPDS